MIPQLIQRMITPIPPSTTPLFNRDTAARALLIADPFDLVLHMEQVWTAFQPWGTNFPAAGTARVAFQQIGGGGQFSQFTPQAGPPHWDHLGYSYVLENTRAIQIMSRVVREYRSGEGLGIPTVATQRWLDITEVLLFGAASPVAPWLSTSVIRQDPEAIRRNSYWRLLGLDLAHGTDDNRPLAYDKAKAANTGFVQHFEELMYELWQAISNVRNISGANDADDDRIFRLAEAIQFGLRSRRQSQSLAREELAAATALGWIDLTLSANTPVVQDLEANATSPSERLRLIGQRVGLAAHSKSAQFFSMAADLSLFLRTIESGVLSGPEFSWILYDNRPGSIANSSRRVITEWGAATGKNFKTAERQIDARPVPASLPVRPQLVVSRG